MGARTSASRTSLTSNPSLSSLDRLSHRWSPIPMEKMEEDYALVTYKKVHTAHAYSTFGKQDSMHAEIDEDRLRSAYLAHLVMLHLLDSSSTLVSLSLMYDLSVDHIKFLNGLFSNQVHHLPYLSIPASAKPNVLHSMFLNVQNTPNSLSNDIYRISSTGNKSGMDSNSGEKVSSNASTSQARDRECIRPNEGSSSSSVDLTERNQNDSVLEDEASSGEVDESIEYQDDFCCITNSHITIFQFFLPNFASLKLSFEDIDGVFGISSVEIDKIVAISYPVFNRLFPPSPPPSSTSSCGDEGTTCNHLSHKSLEIFRCIHLHVVGEELPFVFACTDVQTVYEMLRLRCVHASVELHRTPCR